MKARTKHADVMNGERGISQFLPYSSHVSKTTIVTKDGDYMRTWKLSGISFETSDADQIGIRREQMNTLFRALSGQPVALWTHNIRRRVTDSLEASFQSDYAAEFNDRYNASFSDYNMLANELYITVIYRTHLTASSKMVARSARRTTKELLAAQESAIRKLDELGQHVESSLRVYGMEPLGTYEDDAGVVYSDTLSFLNFLVSGDWQKVRVPRTPLSEYLGTNYVFVGTETVEIRSPTKQRFAQLIDFKDYAAHTEPGVLNGLLYLPSEFVMTQSFSFLDRNTGKAFLTRQMGQLRSTEDGSATQIAEMEIAIDQLIQGDFGMGEYHFTLMMFGDSIEEARTNTVNALTTLQDSGFLATLVSTATDAAFFAQLPCNWNYRPRVARLTTRNFADLACQHNFSTGKRDGNPWGQAVTMFKSPSGQPTYFNFHFSNATTDAFGDKVLGNTRIIGQSGSGKTVLLGVMLMQAQKYLKDSERGFSTFFFDKDQGAKLAILALGGEYFTVKNGEPTGFNPFQMEASEANILFLEDLVKTLVASTTVPLKTTDENKIAAAVRSVMAMPKEIRRLSVVLQNLPEGREREERENSIAQRLARWCYGDGTNPGPLAWVMDCPTDLLDFSNNINFGLDGTDFLDNPAIRTPISMYMLHRMQSLIDGRRFIYFMDEMWKWVDDPAHAEFAGNQQKTIRKKDGLGVFATQMPSNLLASKIGSELVQQCATEIYLPNPKADHDEYINGFKVTEAEYQIIRQLGEESRMFILKQGHSSMVAKLDLNGFDDDLAILSASVSDNEMAEALISEHGKDPNIWLPIFHEQRKAAKSARRLKLVRTASADNQAI